MIKHNQKGCLRNASKGDIVCSRDYYQSCLNGKHSKDEWRQYINCLDSVHSDALSRIPSRRAGGNGCRAARPTGEAGAGAPARPIQPLRIPDERGEVFPVRVVRVDSPNTTLATPPDVVKPERLVLVRLLNLDRQRRLGGPVDSVAEAGVKSVEGGVTVVSGNTGSGKCRFDGRVRAVRDCKKLNVEG